MNNEILKFTEELKNRTITEEDIKKLTEYEKKGYIPWISSSELIEILKEYAEAGNANAQYLIAIFYTEKEYREKEDYQKYLYWLRKSAENGNTKAWYYLAMDGNKKKESFKYCLKSAEIGNISAQNLLGNFYLSGIGCKKDIQKAIYWYKKSAEKGDDLAQESIGYLYEKGIGFPKDYQKAFNYYKKSAEQGNEFAQYSLGYFYEKGRGCQQDYKKALYWYKKSAEDDNILAEYKIGYFYEKGKGCKKNLDKALEYYQKTAPYYKRAKNAYERLTK